MPMSKGFQDVLSLMHSFNHSFAFLNSFYLFYRNSTAEQKSKILKYKILTTNTHFPSQNPCIRCQILIQENRFVVILNMQLLYIQCQQTQNNFKHYEHFNCMTYLYIEGNKTYNFVRGLPGLHYYEFVFFKRAKVQRFFTICYLALGPRLDKSKLKCKIRVFSAPKMHHTKFEKKCSYSSLN